MFRSFVAVFRPYFVRDKRRENLVEKYVQLLRRVRELSRAALWSEEVPQMPSAPRRFKTRRLCAQIVDAHRDGVRGGVREREREREKGVDRNG